MLNKTRRSYTGIVVVVPVWNGFTLANTLAMHSTQENHAEAQSWQRLLDINLGKCTTPNLPILLAPSTAAAGTVPNSSCIRTVTLSKVYSKPIPAQVQAEAAPYWLSSLLKPNSCPPVGTSPCHGLSRAPPHPSSPTCT